MKPAPAKKPLIRARYNLGDARRPLRGFGRPPPTTNIRTAIGAVTDPHDIDGERHQVRINRLVDVLEDERAHRRISEAAYITGQQLMQVFGRARGPGNASNWAGASRVDAFVSKELAVISGIDAARAITKAKAWLERELGKIDGRLVGRILHEGKSFAECAALQGKAGDRGMRYIAARFRDALEQLAEAQAATGAATRREP
jgi:hypothetical protein